MKSKLISVKQEGDAIISIIELRSEIPDVATRDLIDSYSIREVISKEVTKALVEKILEKKEEIIKDILINVNWSEIVRSEVAQRVIKEIANGTNRY